MLQCAADTAQQETGALDLLDQSGLGSATSDEHGRTCQGLLLANVQAAARPPTFLDNDVDQSWHAGIVCEDVNTKRLVRELLDLAHLLSQALGSHDTASLPQRQVSGLPPPHTQHSSGRTKQPKPPALQTAATSSCRAMPAIPASMTGCCIHRRLVFGSEGTVPQS